MPSLREDPKVRELRSARAVDIQIKNPHLTEEQLLATILHEFQCNNNHTDSCSWGYDLGDWTMFARITYLSFAATLLKIVTFEQAKMLAILGLLGKVTQGMR